MSKIFTRRDALVGLAGATAILASPAVLRAQGSSLKMGTFFPLTGPASLSDRHRRPVLHWLLIRSTLQVAFWAGRLRWSQVMVDCRLLRLRKQRSE